MRPDFAPQQLAQHNGFTLLELLLTVILLAGLFAAVATLSRGIFASEDPENLGQAIALAQETLEDYRDRTNSAAAFASIVSQATAPVAGFPLFTRNMTVSTPLGASGNNARMKQVDVTVAWQVQGSTLTTTLSTFITRIR